MKYNGPQFFQALKQGHLASVYWLAGNEPWQLQAAEQALWQQAQTQGFCERTVTEANAQFDWAYAGRDLHSQSLFSAKRLVIWRLPSGKLSENAVKALAQYLQKPNPDMVLVLVSPKLEQHAATQKILSQIESVGVVGQFWPLESHQWPAWLKQRLHSAGLTIEATALEALCGYVEGNMLAASQAIDFLALLFPGQTLTAEQVLASLSQQARFDVFQLGEVFLRGDRVRYQHMLQSLKSEGVEAVLVLWALAKECRLLVQLQEIQRQQGLTATVWSSLGIWDKRRPLYQQALQSSRRWSQLLIDAAACDVAIKGFAPTAPDPWLLLSRLMV